MKKQFVTAVAICLLATLGGCTAETSLLPNEDESYDDLCTFTLSTGSHVSVETRVNSETDINEVWVVQLNETGTAALTAPQHLTPDTSNKIRAKLEKVNSKVYFFANTGNNTLFNTDAALNTFTTATVEAVKISQTGNWGTRTHIPMYGTWTGTPQVPDLTGSSTDKVELTRVLTHLKFTLSASGAMANTFYLESIQLKNVPAQTLMAPTTTPDAVYPSASSFTFADYSATTFSPSKLIETPHTADFFMPENCRGIGPERYEVEKNGTLLNGGANATYLEVKGTLGQNSSTRLVYRFFLGENSFNDYNVKRNYTYTVAIIISGTNPTDTRLTIEGSSNINGGTPTVEPWPSTPLDIGSGDLGINS